MYFRVSAHARICILETNNAVLTGLSIRPPTLVFFIRRPHRDIGLLCAAKISGIGQVLAELALDGRSSLPVEFLGLKRFGVIA